MKILFNSIMPYFLSNKNLTLNREVEIAGEEARHILLAHRIKKGEKIKLQGPNQERYLVEIVDIGRNSLTIKPLEQITVPVEPSTVITLFQSVVSEKALDFIFQKGTELGLNKIVLFNSKNTATKLSSDGFKKKQERWNKILIEAAKQCERVKWPELEFVQDVSGVLLKARDYDKMFLADIGGEKLQTTHYKLQTLALIIGPEGGFTPDEVSQFKLLPNVQAISFGPILLRAETAALAGLVALRLIN